MSKFSRRGEDMLISALLLAGVLVMLALFFFFAVGFVFLMIDAWGKWGW